MRWLIKIINKPAINIFLIILSRIDHDGRQPKPSEF